MNICLDNVFWTTKAFAINLCIVMHHCESWVKTQVCYLQGQGHKGFIWSNYDFLLLWSADPFATKFGLVTLAEFSFEKIRLFCCVQCQGHNEDSKFRWMFTWMISSQLLNLLQPNLVWLCSIIGQSVMWKDWLAIFKVKVTLRANMIEHDRFYHIYFTVNISATRFIRMVHYH